MYAFVCNINNNLYELKVATYTGNLITYANYSTEDLKKVKLTSIKDVEVRQVLREGIQIEKDKILEEKI